MSRMVGARQAVRALAAGIGPGACIGAACVLRLAPVRCDNAPAPAFSHQLPPRTRMSPKAMKQLSSGSVSGFGAGLVVALFSRTLVILGSFLALTTYVAYRYGLDLPQMLGINKFAKQSSWWRAVEDNPWFAASFALTFTLATFVRL